MKHWVRLVLLMIVLFCLASCRIDAPPLIEYSPKIFTPPPRVEVPEQIAAPPTKPFLRISPGMHTAPIMRMAMDQAERYVVTASKDKTARVWDVPTGRLLQTLRPPLGEGNEGALWGVAVSPDGDYVATGWWTGHEWDNKHSIYIFNRASGRMIRRVMSLPDVVFHLNWSPDGRYLATTLGWEGIRIFRTDDFTEAARDTDYGDSAYGATFAPDGRLVTVCHDGHIRLYDADFKLIAKKTAPGGEKPYSVEFSPDGTLVAVGFADSTAVNVLSGKDLSFRYAPNTDSFQNGNLVTKVSQLIFGQLLVLIS